ncbi:hypothetical protein CTRI78_v006610 [Colletotrichum trifolii]|uniref:Uncharacterized protein n=1 Tax=Colletotrichum trifolii TaxID=5466 RepID=A0A4R8RGP1_COLTR|nr:hypothetical protein CTRI78_v006610 [Colletotrichum trifolii]
MVWEARFASSPIRSFRIFQKATKWRRLRCPAFTSSSQRLLPAALLPGRIRFPTHHCKCFPLCAAYYVDSHDHAGRSLHPADGKLHHHHLLWRRYNDTRERNVHQLRHDCQLGQDHRVPDTDRNGRWRSVLESYDSHTDTHAAEGHGSCNVCIQHCQIAVLIHVYSDRDCSSSAQPGVPRADQRVAPFRKFDHEGVK